MSGGFDALRDQVSLDKYARATEDDGGDSVGDDADFIHREQSILDRFTPDTRLGWVIFVGSAVLIFAVLRFLSPTIPPLLTSGPAIAVYALLLTNAGTWAMTRKATLQYWQQFDLVTIFTGKRAIPKIGKIDGAAGDDPLFKEVSKIGMFGLSPEYRTVDDEFSGDQPLTAKVDRRNPDGSWDAAKGKLDHAYLGDGNSMVFDGVHVAHAADTEPNEQARAYDWETKPPDKPDMDAARAVVTRDEIYRTEVIPSYEERITTLKSRLEALKNDTMDDPMIRLSEMIELIDQVHDDGRRTNGHRPSADPDTDYSDIDDAVEDDMEEIDNAT